MITAMFLAAIACNVNFADAWDRDGAAHVTLPRVDIHEIVEVF